MKTVSLYRVAALILVVFCAGHTIGGMLLQKSLGLEADAVFASMKSVRFNFNGSTCTWYGFWFAFGLTASVFLILSAIIAWELDKVRPESWQAVSVIAWALVAAHVANSILTWAYFFVAPGVMSTVVTILFGVGAWQKQSQGTRAQLFNQEHRTKDKK
jgi:hypothetical protein